MPPSEGLCLYLDVFKKFFFVFFFFIFPSVLRTKKIFCYYKTIKKERERVRRLLASRAASKYTGEGLGCYYVTPPQPLPYLVATWDHPAVIKFSPEVTEGAVHFTARLDGPT